MTELVSVSDSAPAAPRLVVIDSQSLFDWLVFRDPACADWESALSGGEWKWIFTSTMKSEFDFVAARGFGPNYVVPTESVADAWRRLAHEVPVPAPLGAADRICCTDRADQMFIDLAIAAGAHTLVSRDRALLKLRKKAVTKHGLSIVPPAAWRPMDVM